MGRPPKIPPTEHASIVKRYKAGEATRALAEEYDVTISTILAILHRAGVETTMNGNLYRPDVRQISEEEAKAVADAYEKGEQTPSIVARTGMTKDQVYICLERSGVKRRSRKQSKLPLNEAAFDVLTDEAAYWIGMLADGCVSDTQAQRSHVLSLGLQEGDEEHVAAFKAFIGAGHKIQRREAHPNSFAVKPQVRVAVSSNRLASKLKEYGLTPRKSLTLKIDPRLQDSPHFWRGQMDANGCVYYPERRCYLSSGSKAVIESFSTFCGGGDTVEVRSTTWVLQFFGDEAVRIMRRLYGKKGPALSRKLAVAQRHWA